MTDTKGTKEELILVLELLKVSFEKVKSEMNIHPSNPNRTGDLQTSNMEHRPWRMVKDDYAALKAELSIVYAEMVSHIKAIRPDFDFTEWEEALK